MSDILYTYDETQNSEGAHLPGVPLADLTSADFDALPEYMQESVKQCAFYVRVTTRRRKPNNEISTTITTDPASEE
jgi:hypothetical protein